MKTSIKFFALFVLLVSAARAELKLASVFSDHMVLQRERPVPVWGTAPAGTKVSVSFAGHVADGAAGEDGGWLVKLPALAAAGEARELTVTGGGKTVTISDVLVGEVWLCSGQSNMETDMGYINDSAAEIAAADYPLIRLLTVKSTISTKPLLTLSGSWQPCAPTSAKPFSAVGYFFGRELWRQLGVPVGLINDSWGGTPAEAWVRPALLADHPDYAPLLAERARRIFADPAEDQKFREACEREQAEWRDKVDALIAGGATPDPAWFRPEFNTAAPPWHPCRVPGSLAYATRQSYPGDDWRTNGSFLLRRVATVGTAGEATLHLGGIVDYDYTWVNGTLIGSTLAPAIPGRVPVPRNYKIPAGVLRAGENVIVIRVINRWGDCQIGWGEPAVRLAVTGGEVVTLAGNEWRARGETALGTYRQSPYLGRQSVAGVMYESKLRPVIPFALRGVIWYQGEGNVGRAAQYRTLFPLLIENWRRDWGQGDFSFYFVQLANFLARKDAPGDSAWAELREAQAGALALPNTGMAVAIDIGEAKDIHPKNKQDVGRRLALIALARDYGKPIEYSGPVFRGMKITGDKIELSFDHTGKGLVNRNTGGPLRGFAIAGADGKFVWATAVIDGDKVVLSSPAVPSPAAARYAWADNPEADLYNEDGLPAAPFRTDGK